MAAKEWGKTPLEVLGVEGPMTRRWMITFAYYKGQEWDTPDRTDYYLMQIACEVRRVLSKNPSKIRTNHFKLDFGSPTNKKDRGKSKEDRAREVTATVLGAIGAAGGKAIHRDAEGNLIKKVDGKKPKLPKEERKRLHRERVEKAQKERRESLKQSGNKKGTMYEKED